MNPDPVFRRLLVDGRPDITQVDSEVFSPGVGEVG